MDPFLLDKTVVQATLAALAATEGETAGLSLLYRVQLNPAHCDAVFNSTTGYIQLRQ